MAGRRRATQRSQQQQEDSAGGRRVAMMNEGRRRWGTSDYGAVGRYIRTATETRLTNQLMLVTSL